MCKGILHLFQQKNWVGSVLQNQGELSLFWGMDFWLKVPGWVREKVEKRGIFPEIGFWVFFFNPLKVTKSSCELAVLWAVRNLLSRGRETRSGHSCTQWCLVKEGVLAARAGMGATSLFSVTACNTEEHKISVLLSNANTDHVFLTAFPGTNELILMVWLARHGSTSICVWICRLKFNPWQRLWLADGILLAPTTTFRRLKRLLLAQREWEGHGAEQPAQERVKGKAFCWSQWKNERS